MFRGVLAGDAGRGRADAVVVHALMDSPSVTGAYRFAIPPGERR